MLSQQLHLAGTQITLSVCHAPVAPWLVMGAGGPRLCLWLQASHWPETIFLRAEPDNEEWLETMTMETFSHGWRRYWANLPLHQAGFRQNYSFKLIWPQGQCWLSPMGLSLTPPARLQQYCIELPDPHPHWVADQIFYQIFPDRFAPGSGDHLVREGEYLHQARQIPVRRRAWNTPVENEASSSTFYGGDLDAITGKLDYLQQLGVTAIYLNPIFTAPSVHKYDTTDYYQVDPHFGGNEALIRLRRASRERGMRLLLDGVFNHSGDTCSWFDRYGAENSQGACHNRDSAYRSWYSFDANGNAIGWKGHPSLLKLDYGAKGVVDAIYQGAGSLVRHWLREPYAIDGWRLDVAHMLGESGTARNNLHHLAGIYQATREENPQAYLLGEHFGDAREWLQDGVEDGAMNYTGFALPLRAFLTGRDIANHPVTLTAKQCAQWMEQYRAGLSHQQQLCQFNQLDSHDTARFFTLLGGDEATMQLALGWLFSWIGAPCLYYGDEIGLEGEDSPFCRATFPWQNPQDWNHTLLAHCRELAALRHRFSALRRGALLVLAATDESLLFLRYHQEERILISLTRKGESLITMPKSPLLTGQWQRLYGQAQAEQTTDGHQIRQHGPELTLWQLTTTA